MDFNIIFMTVFLTVLGWEVVKFLFKALSFYARHLLMGALSEHLPEKINPEDFNVSESGQVVSKVETKDFSMQAKQTHEALFGQEKSARYSIEPHGLDGAFALYFGRDKDHHGANLCALSGFAVNGEEVRKSIVQALNNSLDG